MRRETWYVAVVVGVTLLTLGGSANAQFVCPSPSSPEEGRTLAGENFAAAQEAYEMGRPMRALAHYQCSYQLAPHHNTLYNIGVLAEGIGELQTAVESYREYLSRYPDAPERDDITGRLAGLRARMPVTPEPTPPPTPPEPEPTPPPTPPEPEPTPPPPPPEPEPQPEPEQGGTTIGRIMAWVTLGLGVAIAGAGGALYGVAASRHNEFELELEREVMTYNELDELGQSGWGLELAGWVLMGTGLAAIAASVVLFVALPARHPAGTASGDQRRATITPMLGEGTLGLSFSGSF